MQIFNSDRFVILFHGLCLTHLRVPNTFKFMQCGNNENQMFTHASLPKVNNSGVEEKEENVMREMNPFRVGLDLVSNLLSGSLLKKGNRDLVGGRELSQLLENENHNDLKSSKLISNKSNLTQNPVAAIRNMLDPTRDRIDLTSKGPFKTLALNKMDDPMKKENEIMAIKDLPKGLGLTPSTRESSPRDALNPFKKPLRNDYVDNSKMPSVEDYFYTPPKSSRKSRCSNVPDGESPNTPLDEFPPEHKTIFDRRSPGGIPSSNSNGHKGPRGLRPSFDLDPNRSTQTCKPVY